MGSSARTVGLAVGIPAAIIIIGTMSIYYISQKRQNKEDLEDKYNVDYAMRDDQSFNDFQEELHRTKKEKELAEGEDEHVTEKAVESGYQVSLSNGSSSTSNGLPRRVPDHIKTPSAYDFYEAVIPVFGSASKNGSNIESTSNNNLVGSGNGQDSLNRGADRGSLSQTSFSTSGDARSTTGGIRRAEKSIDNLAKHLHAPAMFDKIPNRVVAYPPPTRVNYNSENNSSSELIHNTLVNQEEGINSHFTFDHRPSTPTKNYVNSALTPVNHTSHTGKKHTYDDRFTSSATNASLSYSDTLNYSGAGSSRRSESDDNMSDPEIMEDSSS